MHVKAQFSAAGFHTVHSKEVQWGKKQVLHVLASLILFFLKKNIVIFVPECQKSWTHVVRYVLLCLLSS